MARQQTTPNKDTKLHRTIHLTTQNHSTYFMEVVSENNLLYRRFHHINFAEKGNPIHMNDAVASYVRGREGAGVGIILENLENEKGEAGGMRRRSLVEMHGKNKVEN